MKPIINCILLIDDNPDDNFIHERVIKKSQLVEHVVARESGEEALEYLTNCDDAKSEPRPDLIFLDINMPGMNGWEFFDEYKKLPDEQKGGFLVIMLTTSQNPEDRERAKEFLDITDFKTKPLTKAMLEEVIQKYYKTKQ